MMLPLSPAHADQKSNMQYTIPLVVDHGGDQKASSKETGGKLKQLISEFMEKVKSKKNKTEARFKGLAGEEATKSVSRSREYTAASAALLEQHIQCRSSCRAIVLHILRVWLDVFITVWGSDGAFTGREQDLATCLPFQCQQLPGALSALSGGTLKERLFTVRLQGASIWSHQNGCARSLWQIALPVASKSSQRQSQTFFAGIAWHDLAPNGMI